MAAQAMAAAQEASGSLAPPTFIVDRANLLSRYNLVRRLRKAIYGEVWAAIQNATNRRVAIKHIFPEHVLMVREIMEATRNGGPAVRLKEDWHRELAILHEIQRAGGHPHVISLLEDFEVQDVGYIMVFEYCDGGELFDRLETTGWTRAEALSDMHGLLHAVAFIHSLGYVHCDLSLENYMQSSGTDSGQSGVRIIDMGGAQRASAGDRLQYPSRDVEGFCGVGKVFYKSPRNVLGLDFDAQKNDVWALGISLFIMMTSIPPWGVALEAGDAIFKSWVQGEQHFRALVESWANIEGEPNFDSSRDPCPNYMECFDPEVWDLLTHLLDVDEGSRYSAAEALAHPCFAGIAPIPSTASGRENV